MSCHISINFEPIVTDRLTEYCHIEINHYHGMFVINQSHLGQLIYLQEQVIICTHIRALLTNSIIHKLVYPKRWHCTVGEKPILWHAYGRKNSLYHTLVSWITVITNFRIQLYTSFAIKSVWIPLFNRIRRFCNFVV